MLQFGVAKELGMSLSEVRTTMTAEELLGWSAYFKIINEDQEKEMEKAQRSTNLNIVGLDNTPPKYGTMLNAKGLKQVEDKKHAALLRRDNNKHGIKYINK